MRYNNHPSPPTHTHPPLSLSLSLSLSLTHTHTHSLTHTHTHIHHFTEGEPAVHLDTAASYALIADLLAECTDTPQLYRHVWTAGDFVIWDNRITLHSATDGDKCHGSVSLHPYVHVCMYTRTCVCVRARVPVCSAAFLHLYVGMVLNS